MPDNSIVDATVFTEEDYERVDSLSEFLDMVKPSHPYSIPLERLLRLNGNFRRGKSVNQKINAELEERRLVSEPPIERADYYGNVIIHDPRDKVEPGPVGFPISALSMNEGELKSVLPTERLGRIKTLMLMNDYSQIPVIQGRNLLGSITWKSLAARPHLKDTDEARRAMVSGGHVAESSDDLFDLVPIIVSEEYIYYRDNKQQIKGIVTATDLAQTFQDTTGYFLRIGEIESRLRGLIDKLPLTVIEEKSDKKIVRKNGISGARDLTFREYISALEDKQIWEDLEIPFDRTLCIEHLEGIRQIRNEIMHFKSGTVVDENSHIDKSLNWLRSLDYIL